MIGLCLLMLTGGVPATAPTRFSLEPVELRRAVVVPAEELETETAALDPEDETPAVPDVQVPLRKAAVVRAQDPTKEH